MLDVYFYEAFEEEAAELQRLLPARFSAGYTPHTIQEAGDATPPSRLISIRTQSQLPAAWATQLDGILSRSTGYDHLLTYAAQVERAPALGYLPLYCHRAVAEQALLTWMALLRRLPRQVRQFRDFHRDGLTGGECGGRTLVVVGVGRIGSEVARLARLLDMRVLGVDRSQHDATIEYVSIDEALPQADVIVCAMDLNRTNRGYFDAEKWRRVKPGAVFVNISRGELSPSLELLPALQSGRLSGVGLDVYDHEPTLAAALRNKVPTDDAEVLATLALAERDECLCTPHNAFNSTEAVYRKSDHSVQQIIAFRDAGAFLWTPPEG